MESWFTSHPLFRAGKDSFPSLFPRDFCYLSEISMSIRHALLALITLVPFSAAVHAQCGTDDNLRSVPCCSPVNLVLPASIPTLTAPAKGLCWTSCNLSGQTCAVVSLASPTPTAVCGEFTAPLSVIDCGGQPLMGGPLVLDYSRTWLETRSSGAVDFQVWRFLAKVNMVKTSTPPPSCPVPACLATAPQCFFYGYVDYAFDCANSVWEMSLVLLHGCDSFQHSPALFSAVPGTFHPGVTYAIVAPDTVLNPFVPVNVFPPGGPIIAEAMRTMVAATPPLCLAEEPIFAGLYTPGLQGCLCPLNLVPHNATIQVGASGACGSALGTLNFWPNAPWFDMIATSIGTWTTTANYPGPEQVWLLEGLFRYDSVCSTSGAIEQSWEIFYGAQTLGGLAPLALDPSVLLTPNFVDLANNYRRMLGVAPTFPLYGKVMATNHVVNFNF